MMKKAFTLIELLIVVAIIAILAAIAVPNFLEAQTRSKVSRVKADQRTLATGIEAYFVDHNRPPREYNIGAYGDPVIDATLPGANTTSGIMSTALSTPVAYLSTCWMFDPFVGRDATIPFDEQVFSYMNIRARGEGDPSGIFGGLVAPDITVQEHLDWFGEWKISSVGPQRDYFNRLTDRTGPRPFELSENLEYDPTNGTISNGNIMRSQKRSENNQPPVRGGLIGAH